MRALLFFLLFPALAAAQPASIAPSTVAGFLRTDLNNDSFDERFVLVMDPEGVIDLYIFDERSGEQTYINYFSATNRDSPILYYAEDNTVMMSLTGHSGIGSYEQAVWIGALEGGYYITSITHWFDPIMADGPEIVCAFDFIAGKAWITRGAAPEEIIPIDTPPLALDESLPESLSNLCWT